MFTGFLKRTLKSETIFGNWKPFKKDEKYFTTWLMNNWNTHIEQYLKK